MFTQDALKKIIPTNSDYASWYVPLASLFPKYGITSKNRIAGFLSQCAHESSDFRILEENLNYSANNLLTVFPRYFTPATAAKYARKPQDIANIVYNDANRKSKLGNTQPGDGWRFRGRGLIQLTGRDTYGAFGKTINKTPEQVVDYIQTKQRAVESALWFWNSRGLNAFADADDIVGMSTKINGGSVGLEDRKTGYANAKLIL